MFEILPMSRAPYLAIRFDGTLREEDILDLRGLLRAVLEHHESVFLLFVTADRMGWTGWNDLWHDVGAGLSLSRDVRRLAMVARGAVDHLMTEAMSPFAHARVRWFLSGELDEAWSWLLGDELPGES